MSDSRWKIVPLDATEAMANESASVRVGSDGDGGCWIGPEEAEDLWSKMLAASPPFEPSDAHVEAVARALCAARGFDPDRIIYDGAYPTWKLYKPDARAAISALIKATEQS